MQWYVGCIVFLLQIPCCQHFLLLQAVLLVIFLINKRFIVLGQNTLEEYPEILWKIHPYIGSHESSVACRKRTGDTLAVN